MSCATCEKHPGHRVEFCQGCGKESHVLGGTPSKPWTCVACLVAKR